MLARVPKREEGKNRESQAHENCEPDDSAQFDGLSKVNIFYPKSQFEGKLMSLAISKSEIAFTSICSSVKVL